MMLHAMRLPYSETLFSFLLCKHTCLTLLKNAPQQPLVRDEDMRSQKRNDINTIVSITTTNTVLVIAVIVDVCHRVVAAIASFLSSSPSS